MNMHTHFSGHPFPRCLHPGRLPFRLLELAKLQASCKKLNLLSELMDHSGNYVHTVLPYILSLLQQGLGQRIHLLTHSLTPDPEVSSTVVVVVNDNPRMTHSFLSIVLIHKTTDIS